MIETPMGSVDAVLKNTGPVINLSPGVYNCAGWAGGTAIPSGTVLRGAGIGLTTLRLSAIVSDQFGGHNTALLSHDARGITVSDLTIDCNYAGLGEPNATLQGIVLRGGDHTIERVRVINASGAWKIVGNPESFIISIFATPADTGCCLTIRDCVVEQFQAGVCTAIATSFTNNAVDTFCRIENNIVRLNSRGGEFGVMMAGCRNGIINGNIISGTNRGLNYESAPGEHMLVTRNAFLNQYNLAALLGGGRNSMFTENIVEMTSGTALLVSGPNNVFSGIDGWQIRRNIFISRGASARTLSWDWPATKTRKFRLLDNEWVGNWTGMRKY